MIDAHVHLFLHPGAEDLQTVQESVSQRTLVAVLAAREDLMAGFTAVSGKSPLLALHRIPAQRGFFQVGITSDLESNVEGKRTHYVIVAKKTGQPYVHSASLATDDEDAVRKHYAARGHEVVLRTCDIEEARRREAEIQGIFRLKVPTIACFTANGKNEVLRVPANEAIRVIDNLHESDNHNRMVEIEWRGRKLQMFAVDILERRE